MTKLAPSLVRGWVMLIPIVLAASCYQGTDVSSLDDTSILKNMTFPSPEQPLDSTLNVLVFGELLPDVVIAAYEAATGVNLDITTHASGLNFGDFSQPIEKFDVILGPELMIESLIQNDQLSELDFESLPELANLQFDETHTFPPEELRFAIPLFFEVLGIAFNGELVGGFPAGWQFLFEPPKTNYLSGKVGLSHDPSILFWSTWQYQHPHQLAEESIDISSEVAERMVLFLTDYITQHSAQLMDREQLVSQMIEEEILVGATWSSDATIAMQKNHALRFVVPNPNAVANFTLIGISSQSERQQDALFFANFLLLPEVTAAISNHASIGNFNLLSYRFVDPLLMNSPSFTFPSHAGQGRTEEDLFQTLDAVVSFSNAISEHPLPEARALPSPRTLKHDRRP